MRYHFILIFLIFTNVGKAQDSTYKDGGKIVTLNTVVLDNKLNVPAFIARVKSDTGFYKAFKNLHLLGFTALNDVRMLGKKNELNASLYSRTKQERINGCRSMKVLEETATGDFYNDDKSYNYYTAQMYASLFFTQGSICNENNIVGTAGFNTQGKKGMEKHKEQLKMLFFNPGKKINGLPFMSNKTAIYDDDIADSYDMEIDWERKNSKDCYVFKQKVKQGKEKDVVVDEMITWFNAENLEVVGRNYSLSYDAGVYDFKVLMEVDMTNVGGFTVPSLIKYNGNWKAVFKKRERGVFTATLSDFKL